jgi:hypothetical protein
MPPTIPDLMTAIDRWGEHTGQSPDNIFTIALLGIERFTDGSTEGDNLSLDDFVEQLRSGEHSRRYRAAFEDKIRRFMHDTGVREPFLIAGIVGYVEWFLEDALENTAKHRRDSEAQIQRYRDMLSDPEEAKRAAERQNQSRVPGMPEQTVEGVYESLDRMEEKYAGPRSLEDLKRHREELDAWRAMVVPILHV